MGLSGLAIGTSFTAGLLASLSPCVYPMIPITLGFLGRGGSQRREVVAFTVGQAVALTALGYVAVLLGEVFGFTAQSPGVLMVIGALMGFMGFFSLRGEMPAFLNRWNLISEKARISVDEARWSFPGLSALLFGGLSAVLASPCSSPILGGILVQVATQESALAGLVLMLAFSSGLSLLFLVIGLGLAQGRKFPRAGHWMRKVHGVSSLALCAFGIFYFVRGAIGL